MKRGDPWYKRYSRDVYEGTRQLSLEERGAYTDILDLIYMHEGPIPDDAKWMSHALHVSTRKWMAVRAALLNAGKIECEGGSIMNARARVELDSKAGQARVNAETAANRERKNREKREIANENNEGAARNEHLTRARQIQTQTTQIQNQKEMILPATAAEAEQPAGWQDLKSALNGSTEAMIADVQRFMGPIARRSDAVNWLTGTVSAFGSSRTAQAWTIVTAKMARGELVPNPLPLWSRTAKGLKADEQSERKEQPQDWQEARAAKAKALLERVRNRSGMEITR